MLFNGRGKISQFSSTTPLAATLPIIPYKDESEWGTSKVYGLQKVLSRPCEYLNFSDSNKCLFM